MANKLNRTTEEHSDNKLMQVYLGATIKAGLIVGIILFIIIAFFSIKYAVIISVGYTLLYWFWELYLKFKINKQ